MKTVLVLALVAIVVVIGLISCAMDEHQPTEPPRGALDTHAWEAKIEVVKDGVEEFISTLEYPAEPTYVTEYRVTVVQVVESTPGGDTHWSVTFILTEDGWIFTTAMRVPPPSESP